MRTLKDMDQRVSCSYCENKGTFDLANGPDDYDEVECPYCLSNYENGEHKI